MARRIPKKFRDLLSRAAWAALWAGLSTVSVATLGLPVYLVPLAAYALSAAKSYVATKVGKNPETVTFRED